MIETKPRPRIEATELKPAADLKAIVLKLSVNAIEDRRERGIKRGRKGRKKGKWL